MWKLPGKLFIHWLKFPGNKFLIKIQQFLRILTELTSFKANIQKKKKGRNWEIKWQIKVGIEIEWETKKVESKGTESTIFYVIKKLLLLLVCFLRINQRFTTTEYKDKDADFNSNIFRKKSPIFCYLDKWIKGIVVNSWYLHLIFWAKVH